MSQFRSVIAVALASLLASCAGAQRSSAARARQVRLEMAEELGRRGDWPRAFAEADALTREEPSNVRARLLRGSALRHQDLLAEAEADLRSVVQAEARSAAAHSELAVLLEQAGRPDEALREHQEAHRLAPAEARYLNNLAFAHLVRREPEKATPLLEEALRADPTNPRYRNNLGFAFADRGDFARAAYEFTRVGTPAQAKNNLGLAYERAGDFGHAFELYLEAWQLDPQPRFRGNLEQMARKLDRSLPAAGLAGEAAPEKEGT